MTPGAGAVIDAPTFRPDDALQCNRRTYIPTWRSALVDAGDPALGDPDGTRSDIGLYGGPRIAASSWTRWWYDDDDDGDLLLYDCDDLNEDVGRHVSETWYDGVDSDCDFHSDYDQDLDGHDSLDYGGDDCDDLDPARNPSALEVPHNRIDEDCSGADLSGADLSDADGDGVSAQVLRGDTAAFADCDDADPSVYPGAIELDDGTDHDCDGFNSPPRPLRVRGCATSPKPEGSASYLAFSLLALASVRRWSPRVPDPWRHHAEAVG